MKFISKGSKFYSILFNKCPRCHSGKFWKHTNPFKNIFNKEEKDDMCCNNCSLLFELEVGFWYGAMYVSYAIGVAIMLFLWGLSSFLFPEINIFNQIFFVIFFILLSAPVNYHYSRLIWINIFVHYKNEFL
jgi:hypothetical protein